MFLVDTFVEDIRKAIACLCCLVCFGPILLIIGIVQFAGAPGATSNRNAMIGNVNNQIAIWNNIEPSFASGLWLANTVRMNVNHPAGDIPPVETLKTYVATDFYATSNLIVPPATFNTQLPPVVIDFVASGTNITGGASVSVKRFVVTTDPANARSNCNRGHFAGSTCTNFFVLDTVCVKVSREENVRGPYRADNRFGGYGCGPGTSIGGSWNPAVYKQVDYDDGDVYDTTYSFNSFTVRSAEDPYIFWLNASGGSWPLTSGQKVLIGTILMVIGGLFMVPCVLFVVIGVVCFRRRKHHHHHEEQRLVYA